MDDVKPALDDLVRELLEAQQAIDALHADLAAQPDLEGKREAQLLELMAARGEHANRLGTLVSRWIRSGGRIELIGARVPAPEPDRDSEARPAVEPTAVPSVEPAVTAVRSRQPVDITVLRDAIGPAWARRLTPAPPPDLSYLPSLERELEEIGEPNVIDSEAASEAEILRLGRALDRFDGWTYLPRTIHRLLLGLVAARARHLQTEACFTPAEDPRLLHLLHRLRHHQSHNDPGFVFGLSREHRPRVSWLEEAIRCWNLLRTDLDAPQAQPHAPPADGRSALRALRAVLDADEPPPEWVAEAIGNVLAAGVSPTDERLARLLGAQLHLVPHSTRFRGVRRAVRALNEPDEDAIDLAAEPALPHDWQCFAFTRGRKAVMVGGEVREDARQRLEASFALASLEWVNGSRVRSVQGLVERIHRRSVDLAVLLVRFMSHPIHEMLFEACKASGTPYVLLERGYGVQNLRHAIERHLGPKE